MDGHGEPVLPRDLAYLDRDSRLGSDLSATRAERFRLFRMPSGFLSGPVGLDEDDFSAPAGDMPGDDNVQVWLGNYNPFFDFRAPGDPGGVGYYRLYTHYQIYENRFTCLGLSLQAATPAGLDCDGVAGGPTVLNPSFAWFHELDNGTALHAFISKNLAARAHWSDGLERSIQYGVAFQSPVPSLTGAPGHCVHMFVEALGSSRQGWEVGPRPATSFEMLPGLHWQVGPNWWMSGGLIFPMERHHIDADLWQITWSWRF
jgi:hypothetical protein